MKRLLPSITLAKTGTSLCAISLLLVACGGSPPPPPASATAQPAPTAAKETVDTSAVPEPTNLVVTARLAKPSQVEKVVGGWTSLPMPGADDVAGLFTDLDVGSLVDLDAPVDVAVVVEGHGTHLKPAYAVAVGVKQGASVASSPRLKSTAIGGGIFKLEQRRKHADTGNGDHDEDDDEDASKICEIIPAAGPSANRLVCGSSEGSLAELGPYLARTAPRASYASDLHVEARLDPLRSTLDQARQFIPMIVGSALSDKVKTQAVRDLINAALGDAVDASLDLDRLKLDMSLSDMNATATLTTTFRDTKSLLARVAVSHPERADVPPPTFWHLPADSKEAFFGRGIDAKDLDHPRELVVDALSKGLDDQGVTPQDRQAVADLVQQYMSFFTSPSVFANGIADAPAPAATPKKDDKKDTKAKGEKADREERLADSSKGAWALGGIEQPFAKVGAFAKSIVTTFHRPGVAKLIKGVMPDGVPAPTVTSAPVNAKLGLPKDTVHLVVSVTMKADESMSDVEAMQTLGAPAATTKGGKPVKPAAPAKPKVKLEKPYVLHWFFVPDAGRSWIGYGADENIVASHLKVALSTSTDPGILSSRAGLDDLKTAKIGSGGFLTLRGALSPSPLSPIFKNQDRDMARMFSRLQNAPEKGATPILFTARSLAPAGQGSAGSLELTLKVPRDSVKDLMAAAMGH